jgi:signal transduction histidine kinase/ActR/RegA family two-component response regulator
MIPKDQILSEAVLIVAPAGRDAIVAADVLREGKISALPVASLDELTHYLERDCGVLMIAEEALVGHDLTKLQTLLRQQETWSDIPIILLSAPNTPHNEDYFFNSGNISVLERPFSRFTMIRAVDVALRARSRQYQVRDLLRAQQLATEKRDEFFATLSHELRTPLNVILGWLQILRGQPQTPEVESALDILLRNARTQKGLIDDLLDISRIVTGKLMFEMEQVSLPQLIRSVTDSFRPRAEQKGIQLSIDIPDQEVVIEADETRFAQVISNLLTNSIKFTPSGGEILVKATAENGKVQLIVKDTGQGVEPAFLPFIFDRLKQEDMSTTRSHGGLGLGLAIAAHIVSAHKGEIRAHSEGRGKGMTITVEIPGEITKRLDPPAEKKVISASLKGLKVLVVDDSPDILELINAWLSRTEADVRLTRSAPEALSEVKAFRPHVLVSDIGMPGMDGYQLISAIRSLDRADGGNTPAIALTAYARDEERLRALSAGFQIHISKPINNGELLSALTTLTGR